MEHPIKKKITQSLDLGDIFGLESNLSGKIYGWGVEANSDLSTLNPNNFINGSRHWGDLSKTTFVPYLGDIETLNPVTSTKEVQPPAAFKNVSVLVVDTT